MTTIKNSLFKKGHIAWNKGKKTGIVPKTVFKKGQAAWNKGLTGYGKGHKVSLEARKKISKGLMGNKNSVGYTREKSWNWKGGELGENHLVRKSVEYSLWRNNIFNKDNYVCQGCGVKGGKLEAHHLYSFADNKEFRFEIWNGQTLCKECHRHLHNELGRR